MDPSSTHLYQPGLLFLPFGKETEERILRERGSTLGKGITWHQKTVKAIDTDRRRIELEQGEALSYDFLIIASGTEIRPDMIDGMLGEGWRKNVFDFYTLDGAKALQEGLANFDGGRLVINIVEMPIKCPVAPLEFAFLADDYLAKRGIRDKTELVYATPLDGAFTKPLASKTLGYLLKEKGIQVESEFMTGEVDSEKNVIRSYDEREVPYDLLVTIPPHMGAGFLEDSDLGDELAFVPTDPHTLAEERRAGLLHWRRHRPSELEGRVGGALPGRPDDRKHPRRHRWQGARAELRRALELLRRDWPWKGHADRLQLRDRTVARAVPNPGHRPPAPAQRVPAQPLGKAYV